jgi:hypothetical protein
MTAFMENKRVLSGILVFLIILQALVSFQVLNRAEVVRIWDEAHYLKNGLYFYHIIFDRNHRTPSGEGINKLINLQQDTLGRPPFLFVLQAFTWRLIKIFNIWNENAVTLIVNTLFLFILALSCYGIGSFLYSRKAGLASAILASFSPIIFGCSRIMMTDLPLTAMVCLSIYLLLKTDRFRSRFFSICLGIILAISQLTRETFAAYMVFPFLYYLYQSLQQGPKHRVLRNLFICLGLGIIMAGPVFLNPNSFRMYAKYLQLPQLRNIHSHQSFYYFINFPIAIGYFIFIPTLPLLISSIINIKKTDKILFLWFLMPMILYSIFPNKLLRFIMPAIPAYALLVSCELFKSRLKPIIKKYYLVSIIFLCFMQYAFIHYVSAVDKFLPKQSEPLTGIRNEHVEHKYFSAHKDLVEVFRKEQNGIERRKRVLSLFDGKAIVYPFEYVFIMEGMPFYASSMIAADSVDAPEPGTVDWGQFLLDSDYLIDKTGVYIGSRGSREDIRGQFEDALLKYKEYFEIVAEIYVPDDNSRVIVYRKKTH